MQDAQSLERRSGVVELLHNRERIPVQRQRFRLDAVVRVDRAPAQPSFEEVRLRAWILASGYWRLASFER